MHPLKLPLHVLDAVERRWAAKLQAEASSWKDGRMQRDPSRSRPERKLEPVKPLRGGRHGIAMIQTSDQMRCPKCGKPMVPALVPSGKGERAPRCFDCDGPDPLKSHEAEGWVKSPLRPPTE
jgi:hypothetical protein